jgi:hypothetical protein
VPLVRQRGPVIDENLTALYRPAHQHGARCVECTLSILKGRPYYFVLGQGSVHVDCLSRLRERRRREAELFA